MIGIYFSGTGNSKYALDMFGRELSKDFISISIENKEVTKMISRNKDLIIAYPIYFSSLPKILDDFIQENIELFRE
ncbi:MAG: hypothetical protein ACRC6T_09260 [Sarcina sp.]